jgi:hypothetical protein
MFEELKEPRDSAGDDNDTDLMFVWIAAALVVLLACALAFWFGIVRLK